VKAASRSCVLPHFPGLQEGGLPACGMAALPPAAPWAHARSVRTRFRRGVRGALSRLLSAGLAGAACGDNHVGGDEQCDGTDVGGITCTDLTGASCRRDGGRSPARPIAPCKARTSDNSGRVRAVAPLVLMCSP